MKVLVRLMGISVAFVVITVAFVIYPAVSSESLTTGSLSSLPGYDDLREIPTVSSEEDTIEKDSLHSEDGLLEICEHCTGEVAGESIVSEDENEVEGVSEDLPALTRDCILGRESHVSDHDIYMENGVVRIELRDKSGISDAYRFIKSQGCVLADSNLEWIY